MQELSTKVSDVLTQLDINVMYEGLKCNSNDHTLLIQDQRGRNVVIYMLSTNQALKHVMKNWQNAKLERYVFSDGKKWHGVDNTTGEYWFEEFDTMQETLFWLANNEYSAQEVRAAGERK